MHAHGRPAHFFFSRHPVIIINKSKSPFLIEDGRPDISGGRPNNPRRRGRQICHVRLAPASASPNEATGPCDAKNTMTPTTPCVAKIAGIKSACSRLTTINYIKYVGRQMAGKALICV